MFDIRLTGGKFQDNTFDVIIIGGGPAGLSAAIYSGRARLKTLLIESMAVGGQITLTEYIENYPGFEKPILGQELAEKMEKQARRFGVEIRYAEATSVSLKDDEKRVYLSGEGNGHLKSKVVMLALGTNPRKLGVPGEEEFTGRGVSYCAPCDAPLFKDKHVIVVGGGDTAVEESLFLTKFAKKVSIVHRRNKLRAIPILQERVANNPKIDFIFDSVVRKIRGDAKVESATIENLKDGKDEELKCDGVFIFVGLEPQTALVKNEVKCDEKGFIVTNEDMETNIKGVYAIGDVRVKSLRQVVTAVSDGAIAAMAAYKYVAEDTEFKSALQNLR